jgi:hypothetical protein
MKKYKIINLLEIVIVDLIVANIVIIKVYTNFKKY